MKECLNLRVLSAEYMHTYLGTWSVVKLATATLFIFAQNTVINISSIISLAFDRVENSAVVVLYSSLLSLPVHSDNSLRWTGYLDFRTHSLN